MEKNSIASQLTKRIHRRFLSIFLLGLFVALLPSATSRIRAYIEPGLLDAENDAVSVIVTGAETGVAAEAVEAIGGRVTSQLWLINAVGATVSAKQVEALASYPGIVSIVENRGIGTADGPVDPEGYVSEQRVVRTRHILPDKQIVPTMVLPDGGAVVLARNGLLHLLNANGTIRATVTLTRGSWTLAPAVAADGTIIVVKEEKGVYAISPAGQLLWSFENQSGKLKSGVTTAGSTAYFVDDSNTLYALSVASGQKVWQRTLSTDRAAGSATRSPVVGPDGTLYAVTNTGRLFAVDPTGAVRWSFTSPAGLPFYAPSITQTGTVFVADNGQNVYGINVSDGSQRFHYRTQAMILAQPTLGPDGTLYLGDEWLKLYALTPDGTTRFVFAPASGIRFNTSPVLSADGSVVYAAAEGKIVYALNTSNGTERWRYQTQESITKTPALDRQGNLIVDSGAKNLVFLRADGTLVDEIPLSGSVTQRAVANGAGDILALVDEMQVTQISRLPQQWDGSKDVKPTPDGKGWDFYSPVTIDVGADVVHNGAATYGKNVNGASVTVAVVDSGVYFDNYVKSILGNVLSSQFVGQADFVGDGACLQISKNKTLGVQGLGYCWTDYHNSVDRYGHGSHVAGTIWNNFTDADTAVFAGVAPEANMLSVRVLGDNGIGTYEDVIEGIQFVVQNKDTYNVRVMNLSLSAYATTPYFVDPLNRAVEAAWAQGITVVAAAGNTGPAAETITVPGSDPYVITVGAMDIKRTAGYWADDTVASWSATGPTKDGFVKPDVLVAGTNIVSYMYNDPENILNSAYLVQQHPDYSETSSLFRMNGTSMATAVASGVVALMLEANPHLTPDQVKYRLMYSAKSALTESGEYVMSPLQAGVGRIWAPDAVFGDIPLESANSGMDIQADLAHPWEDGDSLDPAVNSDLEHHYLGPVQRILSDDGQAYLYFVVDPNDGMVDPLGIASASDLAWLDATTLNALNPTFNNGELTWSDDYLWGGGSYSWSGGRYSWSGGRYSWSGGRYSWSGGRYSWSGGRYSWSGTTIDTWTTSTGPTTWVSE